MLRNKLRHNKKKAIKGGLWPIIHTLMDHPLPIFIYVLVWECKVREVLCLMFLIFKGPLSVLLVINDGLDWLLSQGKFIIADLWRHEHEVMVGQSEGERESDLGSV